MPQKIIFRDEDGNYWIGTLKREFETKTGEIIPEYYFSEFWNYSETSAVERELDIEIRDQYDR